MAIHGRVQQGFILTGTAGLVGALLGGKAASYSRRAGVFNLPAWLASIAGATVLLFAYHLVRPVVRRVGLVRAPLAAAGEAFGLPGCLVAAMRWLA